MKMNRLLHSGFCYTVQRGRTWWCGSEQGQVAGRFAFRMIRPDKKTNTTAATATTTTTTLPTTTPSPPARTHQVDRTGRHYAYTLLPSLVLISFTPSGVSTTCTPSGKDETQVPSARMSFRVESGKRISFFPSGKFFSTLIG